MIVTHPTPSQTHYRHGATACTAIAVMFGTWASAECRERIESIPFRDMMETGAMLWHWAHRHMPPPQQRAFLEATEVLQYGPEALVSLIEQTDFVSGPMDDAAAPDAGYSDHCMSLRRALERLDDANAGVFTRSEHSIGLVRRAPYCYLFDSLGSTLARFDSLEGLERYVRERYHDERLDPETIEEIRRARATHSDTPHLTGAANRNAFSLTLFRLKLDVHYFPLRERADGVAPPP